MKLFSTGFSGFGRGVPLANATSTIDAGLAQPAPALPAVPTPSPDSSPVDSLPRVDLDLEQPNVGVTVTETEQATPIDTALLAAGSATGVRSNNFAELGTNAGPLGQASFNGLLSTDQISTINFGYTVPLSSGAVPDQPPSLSPAFGSLLG